MDTHYQVHDPSEIYSPALLFYKDLIERNIAHALAMVGSPERLRPHVKTHKTREIVQLELAAGIQKHKCATLAEAELLAMCQVPDIVIAYNMVGPNCDRLARLAEKYPASKFSVTADHPRAIEALSHAIARKGQTVGVVLDIDVGQHRTGVPADERAISVYEMLDRLPGLYANGIQGYDGHTHQESLSEREAAARQGLEPVLALRERLERKGLRVPRVLVGGTPTFPVYARMQVPGLECTPGTYVLYDHGYGSKYKELTGFTPAALLLTRVISRPTPGRVTLDLGYKAVASDPPAGKRCRLLDVPEYEALLQNEEHLVIQTPAADRFQPGDVVFAMPTHICPTCAMHKEALVIKDGKVADRWPILARDRVLTI